MSMFDREFIHREIRRLAQAVARVLGLRNAGKLEEARQALADARTELLGPLGATLDRVDVETAARLLGEPAHVWAYASLTWEAAALDGSAETRARAVALGTRALAGDGTLPGARETLEQWRAGA